VREIVALVIDSDGDGDGGGSALGSRVVRSGRRNLIPNGRQRRLMAELTGDDGRWLKAMMAGRIPAKLEQASNRRSAG